MTAPTWPPFFRELAEAICRDQDAASLVELTRAAAEAGHMTVSLNDKTAEGPAPLSEMDPFTFFASINRGITDDKRIALCEFFAGRLGIQSTVPTEFGGIPTVDNTSSWFFGHEVRRDPDDIAALWTLFEQALSGGLDGVSAEAFTRGLSVHKVAQAKLTMGLFWVRPDAFLPVDGNTISILGRYGITVPKRLDWESYRALVEQVASEVSADFVQLSSDAFGQRGDDAAPRYWAGGHVFGEGGSQLERFLRDGVWAIGWDEQDARQGAKNTWRRARQMRVGDLLAIKGYGGRDHLQVHAVGRVDALHLDQGFVKLTMLHVPLFRDKAPGPPGGGNWRDTLAEVTKPRAIGAIFAETATGEEANKMQGAIQIDRPATTSLILYGPPGTGKTYSTVTRTLTLIEGHHPDDRREANERFRELSADGQVEVVTFHQSYGYEEFVEGIRPVLGGDGSGDVSYELHAGAFKRIALRAAAHGAMATRPDTTFDVLWERLLESIRASDELFETSRTGKTYLLEASASGRAILAFPSEGDDDGDWRVDRERRQSVSKTHLAAVWAERGSLGESTDDLTYEKTRTIIADATGSGGGHHYSPLWICYGQLVKFAQEMEEDTSGKLPSTAETIARLNDPNFKFTFTPDAPQYVLVIDEINRGNISKILGELITLLEPDKRLGAENELRLPLAYSPQHRFGVPPNLHIIGTMNTADRSIALMDVALRRRFRFQEVRPDSAVVRRVLLANGTGEALARLCADLLDTLNRRIRFLYDADHELGHSIFLGVSTLEHLREVFCDTVIPMLQEYFYGAWDKVAIVLGCPYDESGVARRGGVRNVHGTYRAPLLTQCVADEMAILGFDHDELESRLECGLSPVLTDSKVDARALALALVDVLDGDDDVQRVEELLA